MIEFLQAYGSWILFGALLLIMMRVHGGHGGGGCGMGRGHQHSPDQDEEGSEDAPTKPTSCH